MCGCSACVVHVGSHSTRICGFCLHVYVFGNHKFPTHYTTQKPQFTTQRNTRITRKAFDYGEHTSVPAAPTTTRRSISKQVLECVG